MRASGDAEPSFNLWTEAWIGLERSDGSMDRLGIEDTLLHCQEYRAIYDHSPLGVVGIHRLLIAVLQAATEPKRNGDLEAIWRAGRFPSDRITAFGKRFAHRFDLFSEKEPFLQTADLPRSPGEGSKTKSVAYLSVDIPAGTAVTHYRHGSEEAQAFCPPCVAIGLACIPPFATSGGQGIKPSINGVPPIYILPGGDSLFKSLALSLLTPDYQPAMRSVTKDDAWWVRTPVVPRGAEVRGVGYLHSLTFPARRVRLHPQKAEGRCTRCGDRAGWLVRTMVFEMGESRSKTAETWLDPFAAYRKPHGRSQTTGPTPVRPVPGRALWREYATLFLQLPSAGRTIRPRVLDQIASLHLTDAPEHFRCVGLRTDMKAKVFEWLDAGFEVPPALLQDESAGLKVERDLAFANDCSEVLKGVFRTFAGRPQRQRLLNRMDDEFWSGLAQHFRELVLRLSDRADHAAGDDVWAKAVLAAATAAFHRAIEEIGDDTDSLSRSETAKKVCAKRLSKNRQEYLNE